MKMKNRSHRHDINRPRPRHVHICNKYWKCVSMMVLIYIQPAAPKQHLKFNS